tara:strand:+ start:594 stop:713 length:120 start_codon:yes stop_codon:yes gene_type:complete
MGINAMKPETGTICNGTATIKVGIADALIGPYPFLLFNQ